MKTAEFYQGKLTQWAWHSISTRTARYQIRARQVSSPPQLLSPTTIGNPPTIMVWASR